MSIDRYSRLCVTVSDRKLKTDRMGEDSGTRVTRQMGVKQPSLIYVAAFVLKFNVKFLKIVQQYANVQVFPFTVIGIQWGLEIQV